MLLNTLKNNKKLKKTLEAGFYCVFWGRFFNANPARLWLTWPWFKTY